MSSLRHSFFCLLISLSSLRTLETEDLVIYSLRSHSILRTIQLPSATQLNASREFIVLVCILLTPSDPASELFPRAQLSLPLYISSLLGLSNHCTLSLRLHSLPSRIH